MKKLMLMLMTVLVGGVISAQEIKNGQTLAFLGDSITQFGASAKSGYVNLVIAGFKANGIDVKLIPAGISGHKSNQMLERLERDVIAKKPDWMTLSCGVNDVWHGINGVPLEQYKQNITAIVEKAQRANIKVMILTATMIGEDYKCANNQKLAAYNDFLRQLAVDKKCLLADLNKDMYDDLAKRGGYSAKVNQLTRDGVHMNPNGDRMMARGILKTFGFTAEQLALADAAWLVIPNSCSVTGSVSVSLSQFDRLSEIAAAKNLTLSQMLNQALTADVARILDEKTINK